MFGRRHAADAAMLPIRAAATACRHFAMLIVYAAAATP